MNPLQAIAAWGNQRRSVSTVSVALFVLMLFGQAFEEVGTSAVMFAQATQMFDAIYHLAMGLLLLLLILGVMLGAKKVKD